MIVRESKVRHVYGQVAKPEGQYQNFRLSSVTGDHCYIKANTQYYAVPLATGGGSLTVQSLTQFGKMNPTLPVLDGHKGPVLDFDFSPFHEDIIATGGDDTTIKLWKIPEGGLTKTVADPVVDLAQHYKKVTMLRFHPTANNVLASGSADHTVKIWDVERGDCKLSCENHNALIQDLVWSYDGSMVASSCKDKFLRVFDPRSGDVVSSTMAHDGAKTFKLVFLGDTDRLCSVGFTRASKRQFKIWDPRNMDKPIRVTDIDHGTGVIMPFFDESTNLLYLGGKGDGNMRYYEITSDANWHIEDLSTNVATKGLCMVPKRSCDVLKCEIARFLKLTRDSVVPLSFICPRKSDSFQADLFPDCYAGRPSLTADEFFSGKNRKPILTSMDPSKSNSQEGETLKVEAFKPSKSSAQLERELNIAKDYISTLTGKLEEHGIQVPTVPPAVAV